MKLKAKRPKTKRSLEMKVSSPPICAQCMSGPWQPPRLCMRWRVPGPCRANPAQQHLLSTHQGKTWWSQKSVTAQIELTLPALQAISSFYLDYSGTSYHYPARSSNPQSGFERKIKMRKTQRCVSQPTVQNCSQQRKFLQ